MRRNFLFTNFDHPPVCRHFGQNVGRGYIDFFTSQASAEERELEPEPSFH